MYTCKCEVCSKTFERLYEEMVRDICYGCALKEFCGNFAPEEGDFNSALIISGEMTEQDAKWLQEDLEAVETGRSIRESYDEEKQDENVGSIWDDYCPKCYEPIEACECGYVKRCQNCHEPISSCCCIDDEDDVFVVDDE